MQYHSVGINPTLTCSPTGTGQFGPVPIEWDIRYSPRHLARVAGRIISTQHLSQLAMVPAITNVHIVSDLLLENWNIAVYNPTGVTVEDILTEIYRGLRAPLTQAEWHCMSQVQQGRIQDWFYARCQASRDFERTRFGGVLRMDCLLHTTTFAGLSSLMFRNNRWEVVLTLSRDFGAQSRSRGHHW